MSADKLLSIATIAATLGAGIIAGVFLAFSTFIMRSVGDGAVRLWAATPLLTRTTLRISKSA